MTNRAKILSSSVSIASQIADLQVGLEALAHAGDWSDLAVMMQHRDRLLGEVKADDRVSVFTSALRCNDRVSRLAKSARQSIVDQLTAMRRGRDMAGRYALHSRASHTLR